MPVQTVAQMNQYARKIEAKTKAFGKPAADKFARGAEARIRKFTKGR